MVSERVSGKWVWRMSDARDEFDKAATLEV
jgi:hypothetical protein